MKRKKLIRDAKRVASRVNTVRDQLRQQNKRKSSILNFDKGGISKQYITSDANKLDQLQQSTGGSIMLEQGFEIKWGRVYFEGGNPSEATVYNFKKPFANRCFGVILNRQKSGINAGNAINITIKSFEVDYDTANIADHFINYIAIGY